MDLPLQIAIRDLFDKPEFPKSESILITDIGREFVLQQIISRLPRPLLGSYRFEHILLSVNQFRKLNQDARDKRLIVIAHAEKANVHECFYKGKVSTPCTDEVDLDRVKPGHRGGRYTVDNTVLSCSRHNRERGCKEAEAYWNQ